MKNIYITSNGLSKTSQVIEFTKGKSGYTSKQFSPKDEFVKQSKIKFDSELESFQMSKTDFERVVKVLGNVEPKITIVKNKIQFKHKKTKLSFNLLEHTYDFKIKSTVKRIDVNENISNYIQEANKFVGNNEAKPHLHSVGITPTHIMGTDGFYFYIKTMETGLTSPLNIELPNIKGDFNVVAANGSGQSALKYGDDLLVSAIGWGKEYPDLVNVLKDVKEEITIDLTLLQKHIAKMNSAGADEFAFAEDNKLIFKFKDSTSRVEMDFTHTIPTGNHFSVKRIHQALGSVEKIESTTVLLKPSHMIVFEYVEEKNKVQVGVLGTRSF